MTQDKMRRVITAVAVACTALLVFLLAYLTYQWITIGVQNNRIAEAEAEVEALQETQEQLKSDQKYFESDYYKWLEAVQRFELEGK
jgi:cell division protein FtsB